jgi:hypothetical protein
MILLISTACQFLSGLNSEIPTQAPYHNPDDWALKFIPETLPGAILGQDYEARIDIGNVETFVGLFSIQQGKLPEGLTLERVKSENSVKIVGTPLETGTFTFSLFVQCEGTNDPGQEGEKEYTIDVGSVPE